MRRILLFPCWVDKSSAISAERLGPGGYTCDTHCGPAISIVLNALADTAKFALALRRSLALHQERRLPARRSWSPSSSARSTPSLIAFDFIQKSCCCEAAVRFSVRSSGRDRHLSRFDDTALASRTTSGAARLLLRWLSIGGGYTPVHRYVGASHEARIVACEKRDHGGDFLRFADPA